MKYLESSFVISIPSILWNQISKLTSSVHQIFYKLSFKVLIILFRSAFTWISNVQKIIPESLYGSFLDFFFLNGKVVFGYLINFQCIKPFESLFLTMYIKLQNIYRPKTHYLPFCIFDCWKVLPYHFYSHSRKYSLLIVFTLVEKIKIYFFA